MSLWLLPSSRANKDKALRIAKELGLNIDQLQKGAQDPDIKKALDESQALARRRHASVPDWR